MSPAHVGASSLEDIVKVTTKKAALGGLALLASAVLLAGCGSAPAPSATTGAAKSNFLPCMVSDTGGFDDHSFNQLSLEGMEQASSTLGVQYKKAGSKGDSDYAANVQSLIDANCNLVVTVGFLLADATKAAAAQNPKVNFATVDDSSNTASNVKPIIFDTAQAAFLAGYAAASYSKTGAVGTFGGMQIPTVTIFMDGFADGVKYFNQQKGKNVKVVGWDVDSQKGSFTGGFAANETAKSTAQNVLDQNVDVIMPVGGPIYQSAAQAIKDSGKPIAMIGVDADVFMSDPTVGSILLTSVMKGMKPAVNEVVTEAAKGSFSNSPYVGTLKNDGVGIAPFHDFASKVDSGLQGELDKIKAGIIDGSIKVASPSSPKQ